MTVAGKGGQPAFEWTDEIEQEIFGRIIRGEAVVRICGQDRDDSLPSDTTFYKRVAEDEKFAAMYVRAREGQAHREADEIRDIADSASPDNYNVARLQIDARKWRASKLAPKFYGEKTTHEHGGPNGGDIPIAINVRFGKP